MQRVHCELGTLLEHPITDFRLISRENPKKIIQSEGALSSIYMLSKIDHCLLSFLHEITISPGSFFSEIYSHTPGAPHGAISLN